MTSCLHTQFLYRVEPLRLFPCTSHSFSSSLYKDVAGSVESEEKQASCLFILQGISLNAVSSNFSPIKLRSLKRKITTFDFRPAFPPEPPCFPSSSPVFRSMPYAAANPPWTGRLPVFVPPQPYPQHSPQVRQCW